MERGIRQLHAPNEACNNGREVGGQDLVDAQGCLSSRVATCLLRLFRHFSDDAGHGKDPVPLQHSKALIGRGNSPRASPESESVARQ